MAVTELPSQPVHSHLSFPAPRANDGCGNRAVSSLFRKPTIQDYAKTVLEGVSTGCNILELQSPFLALTPVNEEHQAAPNGQKDGCILCSNSTLLTWRTIVVG